VDGGVSEPVTVLADGDLMVLRVDRPPANALDLPLLERMLAALEDLTASEPGAVLLTGTGSFFSAGLDLKVVPGLDDAGKRDMVAGINRMFEALYAFPRPVVCAVNGHAVAGGMILALCGDLRVGSSEASYGLTEVKVGIPYPACAIEIVRAELAPGAARRLTLNAGLVQPPVALELGALDELRAPGEVEPRARELAADLATLPAGAYAVTKEALRGGALERMRRAMQETDPVVRFWQEELAPG
jgi:enoyl-CoA hydratase